MEFTTFDNNNSDDCFSTMAGGAGNWWGRNCGHQNINGVYGSDSDEGFRFMSWYSFDDNGKALKSIALMIKPQV